MIYMSIGGNMAEKPNIIEGFITPQTGERSNLILFYDIDESM